MPLRNGRLTGLERAFVKAMASPKTVEQAAHEAGYKNRQSGYKLMQHPIVRDAVRTEAIRLLRDKFGPAMVFNLAQIALDEQQPTGQRVRASQIVGDWAGIGGADDQDNGKELHEMTLDELRALRLRKERELNALTHTISDQATPVIEAEPVEEHIPTNVLPIGAFG